MATQNLAQQPLSETHLAALTSESGLSPATIEARGYRTVSGPEGAAELAGLGFSVAQANTATRGDVLLVPLYDVIGQCVGHQIRPDVPRVSKGSPLKYETPANGVNHVDIPPAGRERVLDGVSPLWVTEGAKTADALAQAGAGVLMLPGVWGFMGKAARGIGTSVLADLLAVPVMGRTVYLAYDSDVVTKESVQAAERRLAEIMGSRGGLVVAVRIPPGPNGAKQGADDYLARGGSLSELVETAQTTQTAGDPMAGKPPQLWAYELAGEGHEIALDIGGEFLLRPIDAAGRCAGPARRYSRDALRDRIVSMAGFRGVVALPMAAANHAVARLSGDHVDEVVTTATSHIVKNGKATWVDMGTVAGWDVIRIGPEGWGYAPWAEVPVWILRDATSKQLTPPAPVGARSWQPLYDVLGLDLDAFAVVRAWLVGLLVADRVPLLWWRGAQGSGKSTRADLVSRVLGLPGLTAAPQNVQDASSKLRASPWLMVENLGKLDPVISDMWCVAVTEGELSERMLYTSRQTRVADRWTGQITSITDVSGALDDLSSRAMVVDAPLVLRHQSATELRGRLADGIAAVRGALFDDAAAVLARVGAGDVSGAEYRFPTMLAAARVLDDLPPAIEVDGASGHHAIAVMNAARSIVSERGENDPWVEWLADEVVRRGGQWRTYAKEILEAQRAFRARMPLYVYDNEIWPGSAHQIGRWLPTRAGRLLERGVVWRKPPREPDGQPHVFFRVVGSEPETPDSTQTLQGQNPRSDTVSVVTVLSVDPLEVHKKNHEEVIKGDGENAIKSDGGVRGERKPPAKTPESTDTPSDLGVSHVVSNVIANVPYSGADPETTSGLASPTGVYEIGRVTEPQPCASIDEVRDGLLAAITVDGALTLDVENTGYPLGHNHYALKTVQLGGEALAWLFDVRGHERCSCERCSLIRDFLAVAPRLHAHSAVADITGVIAAGLATDSIWDRMLDTVIAAKIADPALTGPDPDLKHLSAAVLGDYALSPAADKARAALFKAGKWATEIKVATPLARSGWAQVDPTDPDMLRYAAADVLDDAAIAKRLPWPEPALLDRERLTARMVAAVALDGLPLSIERIEPLIETHTTARKAALDQMEPYEVGNPRSGPQMVAAFERLGVVLPRTKPSKSAPEGNPSVAESVLLDLVTQGGPPAELAGILLDYRDHATALSSFLEPWRRLCTHGDGRVRPTIYALSADTGRMSCVRPNLQAVSREGGFRGCIEADLGHVLVTADLSGVEVRVTAALSQDPTLIEMIRNDVDLHSVIAEQVFGRDFTKPNRYATKRGVFGRFYGGGVPAMARGMGVNQQLAAGVAATMDALFPVAMAWTRQMQASVRHGSLVYPSYSGRPIHLDRLHPHKAANYAIQGTARELIVDALMRWAATKWGRCVLLPIHDELIVMVPEADAEQATAELVRCMTGELYGLPIVAEPGEPSTYWRDAT